MTRRDVTAMIPTVGLIAFGSLVRYFAAARWDFPSFDGGLFFVMVDDLRRADLALPVFTSYNTGDIPFAYPPLGFYCAAVFANLTGTDAITALKWLPVVFTAASLVAFALLAWSLLESSLARTVAIAAFTVLPTNVWLISGGGLTRALGLVFLLLTLWQTVYLARGSRRAVVGAGIALGLTALSHPEALLSALLNSFVIAAFGLRPPLSLLRLAVAWAIGALVAAPWWTVALGRYGPGTLTSAGDLGFGWASGLYHLLTLQLTVEDGFPTIAALAVLGLVACVARRQWLLPLLLSLIVLQPHSPPHRATIAVALLAGVGVAEVIAPAITRLAAPRSFPSWPAASALGLLMLLATVTALGRPDHAFDPLPAHERAAMAWVTDHTATDASFLVVSGEAWSGDLSSEWFPALARRRSVATVQGNEWTGRFRRSLEIHAAAQRCAVGPVGCIDAWSADVGSRIDYLYVKGPVTPGAIDLTAGLRQALATDSRYRIVYEVPGVLIAAVVR